jgi:uncharacterized protein (TIGR00296 family)
VPFQLTNKEGEFLVKLARKAVEEYLKNGKTLDVPKDLPLKLMKHCGVFVTLNNVKHEKKELRGCIGYPYPTTPLTRAVIEIAIKSATQDPRFPPVSLEELNHIVFEVSVLTPPQPIKVKNPTAYPSEIKVGQDGLIVEKSYYKGLLLPQVPIEWNWDAEEFLCQCCIKAGLPPDYWLLEGTTIYKFSCVIAQEITPRGEVTVRDLRATSV